MRVSIIRSLAFSAGVAIIGISLSAAPAFAQPFGTGTDIYWAQTNGGNTAVANPGSSSDPNNFSVDGLWNDTLSTGYPSPDNAPAGSFPSINWSTSSAGTPPSATPPGTYPYPSPNSTDPGFIPGSPGNTNVDVVFDATDGNNSTSAIEVNYSPTVLGLYITNVGKTTEIRTDSASDPQTITIGSDGLTIEPTVATSPIQISGSNILFGNANAALTLALNGSQTWANLTVNNTGVSNVQGVTFSGPVTVPASVTSPLTLTLSAPGDSTAGFPANNHLNGYITDNHANGGVLSIDVTSGQWTFGAGGTPPAGGPSTYTGGLTVENTAQVRDIYISGAGTGTVTVNSGGSFCPNIGTGTNANYTNAIVINGVGNALAGVAGLTTFGAIHSMNTGAAASTNTDTLSGGITLNSNSLVEAQFSSLIINTSAVVLGSNTLTLAGAGGTDNISVSIASQIQGLGGGVTVNTASGTSGTVTLSNSNNTYSGSTIVQNGILALSVSGGTNNIANSTSIDVQSSGTLNVNGLTGTGGFNLASGQTLTGSGTVNGMVTALSGSIIAPGDGLGTITMSKLALASGSILNYQLNPDPANDFINVSGSAGLTLNGGSFNLFLPDGVTPLTTPGIYDLIGYSGAIGGTGTGALSVGNPQPGLAYQFGLDSSNSNDVDVTIIAVPEPTSLLLLAIGGLGLAAWTAGRRMSITIA